MPRLARLFCILFALAIPTAPRAGEVTLRAGDLVPTGPGVWKAPSLALPTSDPDLPLLGEAARGGGARLLRHLGAEQPINGFGGFLYDNRDRGHSTLRQDVYPRLTFLRYADDLVAQRRDYGLAGRILLPTVVFGNSSTAITAGATPRSQTRLAMTAPGGPETQARLYRYNHLYVYPEHRDHDRADLFPANWPYTITSQGSSGSDQPFLNAIALTLAAFPPETFAELAERGLIAPTLQMLMRRSQDGIYAPAHYLSGRAHPPVFDGARVQAGRMVAMAARMQRDAIPPAVQIDVVEEDFGEDAGLADLDERLFDTPSAIARVWRGFDWQREITLSAGRTVDPNGRRLRFEWRVLSGDPDKVEITPLGADGATARIRITWHDPFAVPVAGDEEYDLRQLSRVDIGVFAFNGVEYSAPAFLSVAFPAHQRRRYATREGGPMRLVSVDYDARARGSYYDPALYWSGPWTDEAIYDRDGNLTGWERTMSDGGTRTVPAAGQPDAPRYRIDTGDVAHPRLVVEQGGGSPPE